jgi:hypothetical protein
MARDDWRIRIELPEPGHAESLLGRIGLDLGNEARELAHELEERRLAVSRDENLVFVYAATADEARRGQEIVEVELAREGLEPVAVRLEQWLPAEERWSDEPPGPTYDEEMVARGLAPWEVRVECGSHAEADQLADRLEEEGWDIVRRWRYLVVGAASREEAEALAQRVHGEVEAGGAYVWETVPRNPFVVFGGMGGTGTPM